MTRFGSEERNIGRLTPVLALNRVPAGMTGWKKTVQIDGGGLIEVSCLAGRHQVVPHGLDADVIFALTTLYVLHGRAVNGFIEVTVPELCRTIGLEPSAPTYERVRQSIQRLRHVSYQAFECWSYLKKNGSWGWRSHNFGIVNSLGEVDLDAADDHGLGRYQATTVLRIGLSPELVDSIRDGHVRAVDLDFYAQLEQPMSRLLYRTLEEQRNLPGADHHAFRVPLMAWGDHLGLRGLVKREDPVTEDVESTDRIPDTEILSPDKIRRALAPAHEELQRRSYLKAAEYVGRGREQRVDYTFGVPSQPVDITLVVLLTERGISAPAAEKHVRTHSADAVQMAVAKFDARKQAGYAPRNPGGLLADMLDHPEKYPAGEQPSVAPRVLNAKSQPVPAEEPAQPAREARTALVALGRRFEETATLRELRDRAVQLYLVERVSVVDLAQLAQMEVPQAERVLQGWEETTG